MKTLEVRIIFAKPQGLLWGLKRSWAEGASQTRQVQVAPSALADGLTERWRTLLDRLEMEEQNRFGVADGDG